MFAGDPFAEKVCDQVLDHLEGQLVERGARKLAPLAELGARMIDPGLWSHLKGMEEAEEIIERRVILPLAEPDLAARHAVAPPRAIVLFGPPGTGKTTFAKGIASRLTWPFIEIQPAELTGEGPRARGQPARAVIRPHPGAELGGGVRGRGRGH